MTTDQITTTTCAHCDIEVGVDVAYPATRGYFCPECAADFDECDYCDLWCTTTQRAEDGDYVCADCAVDYDYGACEACSVLVRHSTRCSDHDFSDPDSCDEIHDYSYKPKPVFHGTGPCYLGMELEITVPSRDFGNRAEDATTALGTLGYLKDDASISCGFELVTHPMAYTWALDSFPWTLLEHLARRGCSGEDNGLHVHISRDAFTGPCHIYRWMKFIHRNASRVQTLARREDADYAAFTDVERGSVKHTCKGDVDLRRNVAINTQNASTFELRVFAGSLSPQQVQAALAFADASVRYTRTLTVPAIVRDRGWDWFAFTDWLHTRPRYAPLTRELADLEGGLACAC